MDVRPVGTKLFHADGQTNGQTDMTKLAPKYSWTSGHMADVE